MGVYLGLGGCKFHHVIACCIALKLSQHCQPRTDLMVNVKIIWETTGIAFWSVPPPSIFAVMEDWNRLSHWSVPLESDPPPLHTAAGTFLQRMWPLYPLRPKPLRDLSCPEERSSLLLCHSHLCSSLAESEVHTSLWGFCILPRTRSLPSCAGSLAFPSPFALPQLCSCGTGSLRSYFSCCTIDGFHPARWVGACIVSLSF